MSAVLILCACILAQSGWKQVMGRSVENQAKKTVVIDAGHADSKMEEGGTAA